MTSSPFPMTPTESAEGTHDPEMLDKELDEPPIDLYPPEYQLQQPEDRKTSNTPSTTKSPEDSTLAQSVTIDMDRGMFNIYCIVG